MKKKTITIYKDGNAFCAAVGSYPACTGPATIQGWGDSEVEALEDLINGIRSATAADALSAAKTERESSMLTDLDD